MVQECFLSGEPRGIELLATPALILYQAWQNQNSAEITFLTPGRPYAGFLSPERGNVKSFFLEQEYTSNARSCWGSRQTLEQLLQPIVLGQW